ncbi:MAG: T9SS type A sorting domain-containing protein [Bacteroidetes bacterium]|nr:T9SS type A sorting domain-containing protein [Bacteroidota bacterium]
MGLTCSTNYEWRIRSICTDGSTSTYCPIQTFSTNSCKLENELENNEETIEIFSYGNNLNIQIDENINKEYNLKVFTITGELVYVNMIQGSENILQLDLPTGIYIVNLANESVSINKTIAINN